MAQTNFPRDAQQGLRRVDLAAISPSGSIAARQDPNSYNSILSRKYPGLFGQFGASNPMFQASMSAYKNAQAQRAAGPVGLRRAPAGVNPWQWQQLQQMYGGRPMQAPMDDEELPDGY